MSDNQKLPNEMSLAELFDLRGKAALVTGGAMGIGGGIATRLAEAGAAVMIADINLEAARAKAKQISDRDWIVDVIETDVTKEGEAERVVQATVAKFGRLDILVNNAGMYPMAPALELSEAIWDKTLNLNLKAVFFWAQAAARQMINAGRGGKIVNIASVDALHPTGNLVHYDASKGGVVMVTKALALELGPHNIRVNAIAPGSVDTEGARAMMAGIPPEVIAASVDTFTAKIPVGRGGNPDDIARTALFLASPASDYQHGSLTVVDGGYLVG